MSDQIPLFWFRESTKTIHSLHDGVISSLFYEMLSLCGRNSGLVLLGLYVQLMLIGANVMYYSHFQYTLQ